MNDDFKKALRISPSNTALDGEIDDLILAAVKELELAGVLPSKANQIDDPLIKRALTLYCKANLGFDNPEAARFQASYESLKNHLSMSVEYTVEPVVF